MTEWLLAALALVVMVLSGTTVYWMYYTQRTIRAVLEFQQSQLDINQAQISFNEIVWHAVGGADDD